MLILRKDFNKFGPEYILKDADEDDQVGDISELYLAAFNDVVRRSISTLEELFKHRKCTADIISGWRHGYSAEAVGRYIIAQRVLRDDIPYVEGKDHFQWSLNQILLTMKLKGYGWGWGYNYCPSIDELSSPPAVVQADINRRLANIRKLSVRGLTQDPYYIFNDPIPNAGAIHHETEIEPVTEFIDQVNAAMKNIIGLAFDFVE